MSNMMPGDNSGAEPEEHSHRCKTQCEYVDHAYNEDEALHLFMLSAQHLTTWRPGRDETVRVCIDTNEAAWAHLECPAGHRDHDCNCDEIANDDAENDAEGLLDALEGRR